MRSLLPRKAKTRVIAAIAIVLATAGGVWAIVTDISTVRQVHQGAAEHADQFELIGLPATAAFAEAFELGDELFATAFDAIDGGGANVGRGQRFTRVARRSEERRGVA